MEDYIKLNDLIRKRSTDVVLKFVRRKNINPETFAELNKRWRGFELCSSPLGLAIIHGRLHVMNALISLGFDPKGPCREDYESSHPLQLACEYNRLDIIRSLHHFHGIDMDSVDDYGFPAMVNAVFNRTEKTVDVVKTLVEAGASVNTSCRNGMTPLAVAIDGQNIDVCRYLISKGADVNVRNQYTEEGTYLMRGIKNHVDIAVLRLLIESGADMNAGDEENKTSLIHAIDSNAGIDVIRLLLDCANAPAIDEVYVCVSNDKKMKERVKVLVKSGAAINLPDNNQVTPLMYALRGQANIDVIRLLVESGAAINLPDNNQVSPLMYALRAEVDIDVIRLLLESGADVNVLDKHKKSSLMYATERFSYWGKTEDIVKVLIQAGDDVNELENNLTSPIRKSAKVELYRLLVEAGADINALDKDKKTPLHYVLESNGEHTVNIVHHLIESGADVNALDINDVSPLMYALKYTVNYDKHTLERVDLPIESGADVDVSPLYRSDVARVLLESGAKVNVLDKNQKSPLHYAVENSELDNLRTGFIQVLVNSGADVNIQDENGDSPLMYELKHKARVEVILMLLECGADVCTRNQEDISPLSFIFKWFDDFNHMKKHDGGVINLVKMFLEHAGDVKGHLVTLPYTRGIHDAFDVIRTLCTTGADIEARDATGNTVLHQVMTKIVPCSCAKCFNLVHFLIVELNLSLWTLNNASQTAFRCALRITEFRREPAANILKLCVQAGYTPDSGERAVVRRIEERLSTDIEKSDVTSLQDLCCFSVRRALGRRLPTAVNSLPIPEPVKQYVKLTHVHPTVIDSDGDDDNEYYSRIDCHVLNVHRGKT